MIVLTVETCVEPGSVALAKDEGPPDVVALPGGWHSTTLHTEILRLLARHGLDPEHVQGFGVTTGPGAFTAVRVGLAAVKGLAEAHGKPVVPVSTLQLIAAAGRAAMAPSAPSILAPILDARRGQVFCALYRGVQDGQLEQGEGSPILPERVCSLASFLDAVRELAPADVLFCGAELDRYANELEKAGWGRASLLELSPCLAGVLATIAVSRLSGGRGLPALRVEANYVRVSDAELFWKE